jgi:DNA repair exonuclease SbcCD ATPase subunit
MFTISFTDMAVSLLGLDKIKDKLKTYLGLDEMQATLQKLAKTVEIQNKIIENQNKKIKELENQAFKTQNIIDEIKVYQNKDDEKKKVQNLENQIHKNIHDIKNIINMLYTEQKKKYGLCDFFCSFTNYGQPNFNYVDIYQQIVLKYLENVGEEGIRNNLGQLVHSLDVTKIIVTEYKVNLEEWVRFNLNHYFNNNIRFGPIISSSFKFLIKFYNITDIDVNHLLD